MSASQPTLLQVNTRVWLTDLSGSLGRRATLDDIPDADLDRFADLGIEWIWWLSIWQTGPAARAISRASLEWRCEFQKTLPDLTDDDIGGSGFAITSYQVHRDLGGDAALARLRERMRQRGLKLMLDFVPNHMAPDHPWVDEHPDYFVSGTDEDVARTPQNYFRVTTASGSRVFAHGRDPFFSGWSDTIQLNYGNAELQAAMIAELARIATQCDGVRCDMAMLLLPEVFQRTWGISSEPFWPTAIERVRSEHPTFLFLAEVYWDLEWTLQQQGFDFCYDKRLYDRLHDRSAKPIREHLCAELDFQNQLARFLENHDEPRAAATFDLATHRAAAVVTYLVPGLRFFQHGQFEGRRCRVSPHLVRAPTEPLDADVMEFYDRLLAVLRHPVVQSGSWQRIDSHSAWDGNWTHECLVAFAWGNANSERLIVVVNIADHPSQACLPLPFDDLAGQSFRLEEQLVAGCYDRDGDELAARGLFVDLPAWGQHVLTMTRHGHEA